MRYQGRITTWKDDKGFGFITPNGSDAQVFVHIKAFTDRHRRPAVTELVTYQLGADATGRARAEKVAFVGDDRTVPHGSGAAARRTAAGRPIKSLIAVVLVALLAWQGYAKYQAHRGVPASHTAGDSEASSASTIPLPLSQFSCDGRMHCSQMRSCAEATYFLKNCPGVMMDGDNDGIPCEEQLCKRTR